MAKRISNILIALMSIGTWIWMLLSIGHGSLNMDGFQNLQYFTVLSNLLCGIVCIVDVFRDFSVGRFIGTVSVSITFLVVILALGPMYGYAGMFMGGSFFMHGLVPVFAIGSFLLWGKNADRRTWKYGAISVGFYAFLYMSRYVVTGKGDLYGFAGLAYLQHVIPNMVFWVLEVAVFTLFGLLVSFLLYRLKARLNPGK